MKKILSKSCKRVKLRWMAIRHPVRKFMRTGLFFLSLLLVLGSVKDIGGVLEEIATQDIDLNDIYYYIRNNDDESLTADKQVVLVNLGSFPVDSLRPMLVKLLSQVDNYGARAVGVDVTFEETGDPKVWQALKTQLRTSGAVIAMGKAEVDIFADLNQSGIINLPEIDELSVRHYYTRLKVRDTTRLSFAHKLFQKLNEKPLKLTDSTMMLRYDCGEGGYYNALDTLADPLPNRIDYPAIEATSIQQPENAPMLKNLLGGKIVLFGWIGVGGMMNDRDITDRFKTPLDRKLVNRNPSLPGLLIHAVALEMLLKGITVTVVGGVWYWCVAFVILMLQFLIFTWLENWTGTRILFRIRNRLIHFLASKAIHWTIFALWVTGWIYVCIRLMGLNVYLSSSDLTLHMLLWAAAISIESEYSEHKIKKYKK